MSDLLGEEISEIEYPKTLAACHAEIDRLARLIEDADKEIDRKDEEISDLENELDEIEEDEPVRGDTEQAIHAFLDEVERVGPLRFDVPQTEQVNRAIVALHDIVGRAT